MLRKLTHRTQSSQRNTKRIGSCREYNRHESRTLHITAQFLHNQPVQSQYFPRLFRHSYVVGYNSVLVKGNQMNLLNVAFEKVGTEKAYLNDVMEHSRLTSYSGDASSAGDYILPWDAENGDWLKGVTWYYVDQPGWNYEDVDYTDTWMNQDFVPVNPELESGASFWLYHKGEDIANFQFSGQVTKSVKGQTLAAGAMNLCGNPFPTELNLANKSQMTCSNPTSYASDASAAGDYVLPWDVTAGDWVKGVTYYYVNQPGWNYEDVDYTDTWMNQDFVPGDCPVQAGAGFWYYSKGVGNTLSFPNPF